jgi:hypothetical protein
VERTGTGLADWQLMGIPLPEQEPSHKQKPYAFKRDSGWGIDCSISAHIKFI